MLLNAEPSEETSGIILAALAGRVSPQSLDALATQFLKEAYFLREAAEVINSLHSDEACPYTI